MEVQDLEEYGSKGRWAPKGKIQLQFARFTFPLYSIPSLYGLYFWWELGTTFVGDETIIMLVYHYDSTGVLVRLCPGTQPVQQVGYQSLAVAHNSPRR